jgi:hypothetical protein
VHGPLFRKEDREPMLLQRINPNQNTNDRISQDYRINYSCVQHVCTQLGLLIYVFFYMFLLSFAKPYRVFFREHMHEVNFEKTFSLRDDFCFCVCRNSREVELYIDSTSIAVKVVKTLEEHWTCRISIWHDWHDLVAAAIVATALLCLQPAYQQSSWKLLRHVCSQKLCRCRILLMPIRCEVPFFWRCPHHAAMLKILQDAMRDAVPPLAFRLVLQTHSHVIQRSSGAFQPLTTHWLALEDVATEIASSLTTCAL